MKKIYLSGKLDSRGGALRRALTERGVAWEAIPQTRDIWVRDFMPVRNGAGAWVAFRYQPGYLRGLPGLRTDYRRDLAGEMALEVRHSSLRLDGGNVVFTPDRRRAVVSERVFRENPRWEPGEVIHCLEEELAAEVILIPALTPAEDMTGHADGMVRFLDDHTALGNRVPGGALEAEIRAILQGHGIAVVDFPCDVPAPQGGIVTSAAGSYLNFLETEEALFLPQFGLAMDSEAVRAAEGLFHKTVVPVDCAALAAEGGGLHCVTWEADDALRRDWVRMECYHVQRCPVCGHRTLDNYWICPHCDWEAEGNLGEEEPSDANGDLTAAQYRRAWDKAGRPLAYPEDVANPDWRELDGAVYLRREDVEHE